VLPNILTGVRLAVGTAWLVIVAAEMLTGGIGIGFWVWDEWNNLKVEHILIAIVIIGLVGLALEHALLVAVTETTSEADIERLACELEASIKETAQ
jgi:nitrate/nitrite transport system permease protein